MKTSEHFKIAIQTYLEQRALTDELFAKTYHKENKNIDDCLTYILNTVKNSGCNGFAPEEVYSMAVHYYDEDNIKVGSPINCKVIVNQTIELTAEEKEQAHKDAIKRAQDEAYAKYTKRNKPTTTTNVQQASLF